MSTVAKTDYALIIHLNSFATEFTCVNEYGKKFSIAVRIPCDPRSTLAMNRLPTLNNASYGHGWNQSMT
jgi:hypothetical protein